MLSVHVRFTRFPLSAESPTKLLQSFQVQNINKQSKDEVTFLTKPTTTTAQGKLSCFSSGHV